MDSFVKQINFIFFFTKKRKKKKEKIKSNPIVRSQYYVNRGRTYN